MKSLSLTRWQYFFGVEGIVPCCLFQKEKKIEKKTEWRKKRVWNIWKMEWYQKRGVESERIKIRSREVNTERIKAQKNTEWKKNGTMIVRSGDHETEHYKNGVGKMQRQWVITPARCAWNNIWTSVVRTKYFWEELTFPSSYVWLYCKILQWGTR